MIKSYTDFLNEKVNSLLDIRMYIDSELDEAFESDSFSVVVKEKEKEIDKRVDKGYKLLNDKFGPELMQKYIKQILKNDKSDDYCNAPNGLLDLIFYRYNNKFPLGANPITVDDGSFIRYIYGWHNMKYGKLAIEQEFSDMDKYFNYMVHEPKNYILETDLGKEDEDIAICGPLILDPYDRKGNGKEFTEIHSIGGKKSILSNKVHFNKKIEKDQYISLIEILDPANESKATKEDWLHLFDQALEKFPELSQELDWVELLKDKVPNSANFIQSKLGISKYNL